jgi:hypothetical protein
MTSIMKTEASIQILEYSSSYLIEEWSNKNHPS